MKKFLSFLYKFAATIMMIIGVLAAILWAIQTGFDLTNTNGWLKPSEHVVSVVGFSISIGGLSLLIVFGFLSIFSKKLKWISALGKFIIMTISIALVLGCTVFAGIWLQNNNAWSPIVSTEQKITISIFSIGVILLSMYVIFGILTCNYRRKMKKASQQANA